MHEHASMNVRRSLGNPLKSGMHVLHIIYTFLNGYCTKQMKG
jgi:hypothetical protein